MIHVSKYTSGLQVFIRLSYPSDLSIETALQRLPWVHFSNEERSAYLPYDKTAWKAFLQTGLPYHIDTSGTTGCAKPLSDNTGPTLTDVPQHCTTQAAVYTSSIRYAHPYFYIRNLSPDQRTALKALRGVYWNTRYQNWVVPATQQGLHHLHKVCHIISAPVYEQWLKIISDRNDPQVCILYCSPEYPESVLIQLKGMGVDVDFLKYIPQRTYHSEGKFWLIPYHPDIIQRISDHYQGKGVQVISRIRPAKIISADRTHSEYKHYLISKTPETLRYALEPYLNTLITQRYSLSTIREYYGKFVKFAESIHPRRADTAKAEEVNAWLCKVSESRVTESLLNSYINAIKFYYQKVMFRPDFEIEKIKRPRNTHHLPKVLSVTQVDAMLRATHNLKHTALLYALYGHGLRLNELLSVRTNDLLWDRNQIFVHKGKGKEDRYIPMSQEFKSLIRMYIHEYRPQYWLFEGQDAQRPLQ
jgi:integrase